MINYECILEKTFIK
jgi:hypothetical protein